MQKFIKPSGILICSAVFLAFCSVTAEESGRPVASKSDYSLSARDGSLRPGSFKAKGVIRIGVQEEAPPFTTDDADESGTKHPGFDVELAKLIGEKLGVKVRITYGEIPQLIRMTSKGELDLSLGALSTDIDRGLAVNFTTPYLTTTPAALLSRRALPPESQSVDFAQKTFTSIKDLNKAGSLRIGVNEGTTNEKILRSDPAFNIHSIKTYESNEDAVEALEDGEIDALIADGLFIKSLTVSNPELLAGHVQLTGRYRDENISAILPPGNAEYWMFMNFIISELVRTGEVDRLYKKYFESGVWVDD